MRYSQLHVWERGVERGREGRGAEGGRGGEVEGGR